jgi:hypothetical protein
MVFYREWRLAPEIQLFSEVPNPELAEGEGSPYGCDDLKARD